MYVVWCQRSANSILGAAAAPMKSNGKVVEFPTLEDARAEAERLNRETTSRNVSYSALDW